ncbi:hypothetical protein EDD15DRAFT_2200431 [Pisolithus albus]|nr:hypothetical protein EDD15DRAFT_2200431 [Pisolithus albus]
MTFMASCGTCDWLVVQPTLVVANSGVVVKLEIASWPRGKNVFELLGFLDMRQGKQSSPDIQWAVVRLSQLLTVEKIAMCLELSTRTVRHIISHFRMHGVIPHQGENKDLAQREHIGNRHLRDVDVEFLHQQSYKPSNSSAADNTDKRRCTQTDPDE